jgi:hypothetical protein
MWTKLQTINILKGENKTLNKNISYSLISDFSVCDHKFVQSDNIIPLNLIKAGVLNLQTGDVFFVACVHYCIIVSLYLIKNNYQLN